MSAQRLALTSSPQDRESEMIAALVNMLTPEVMERAAQTLREQMHLFNFDETEHDDYNEEDDEEYLRRKAEHHRFFEMRRMAAEHGEDVNVPEETNSTAEVLQEVNTVLFQAPQAENLWDTPPASHKLSTKKPTLILAIKISESSEVLPEEVKFTSKTSETDFARVDPTPTILQIQVLPVIAEGSEESEAGGQPTKVNSSEKTLQTFEDVHALQTFEDLHALQTFEDVHALQTFEDLHALHKSNSATVKKNAPCKPLRKGLKKTCIGEKKENVPKSEEEALTKPDQCYAHLRKPNEGVSASDQAGRVTQMSRGPSQATKTSTSKTSETDFARVDPTPTILQIQVLPVKVEGSEESEAGGQPTKVNSSEKTLQTFEDVHALHKTNSATVKKKAPCNPLRKGLKKTCIGEKKENVPKSEEESLTKPDQCYAHPRKPNEGVSASDQAGRVTQMSRGPSQATKTSTSKTSETDFARVDPTPTILQIQVLPVKVEGSEESEAGGQPTKVNSSEKTLQTFEDVHALHKTNSATVKKKAPCKPLGKGLKKTCIGEKKENVPNSEGKSLTKPDQCYAHPRKPNEGVSVSALRKTKSAPLTTNWQRKPLYKGVQASGVTQMSRGPSQATKTDKTCYVVSRNVNTLQTSKDVSALRKINSAPVQKKPPWKPFYKGVQKTCIGEEKKILPKYAKKAKPNKVAAEDVASPNKVAAEDVASPNKVAAEDVVIDLEHSEIAAIIRGLFQSLSEEQWREVSEGVYNIDVKEQLVKMCTDVLQYSADSIIRHLYRSILKSSPLSETFILRSPLSRKHLPEKFNQDIQRDFERIFEQAFHDVLGGDTQVTISPELGKALAAEVLQAVNTDLFQAPLAENLCDTPPASRKLSTDKTTLTSAIATMRSILTGRAMVIKMKTQKKSSEIHPEEDSTARDEHIPKKKSFWKRLTAWRKKKVSPGQAPEPNKAVSPSHANFTFMSNGEQEHPSHAPSTPPDSGFFSWRYLRNIFKKPTSWWRISPVLSDMTMEHDLSLCERHLATDRSTRT
ncbi:uncharacterized protein LOC114567040 [Xyrichtys novacula]|uniref:Uncharacterized protein LOC114567040 n=1 Tax=Xyrichtys novacula TaxID=13765 RepID=A0AAV1EZD2_XYRNO|nr:uncharacterized protein LOC114567040 [Xyrichtys novacula]